MMIDGGPPMNPFSSRLMSPTKGVMKMSARCLWCERKIKINGKGRPRVYCGPVCRQRAYEARRLALEHPGRMLADVLEEKRGSNLSAHDRRRLWHAEQEVARRVGLELLKEIAQLRPDALVEWLEDVRREPTPLRLKELRKLPRVQPVNDNGVPRPLPLPW